MADSELDYKTFLKNLTTKPGVYQMYGADGEVLYVGKAKNLKNRVSSYFRASGLTAKTMALVRRIASIEVTITKNASEALLLEQNLIKAQKPPYNITLRDDKSYPYIYLSADAYPRLALHRGAKRKQGRYFGPFPNVGAVRESLQFLKKTFKVRQCEDSVYHNRTRPCLQYQIGRCKAPCVGWVDKQEYDDDVRHTQMFLEGNNDHLHTELASAMHAEAEAQAFEKAAQYRDQITALRAVQGQFATERGQGNVDVVAASCLAGEICVHVLFIRQGRMLGSKSYFPKGRLADCESDVLEEFIPQFYINKTAFDVPSEILISHPVESKALLAEAISATAGRAVSLNHNVRTHRAEWLAMALTAAEQNLKTKLNNLQSVMAKLDALQAHLGLDEPLVRIECFDISHSSGERPVASCVVFDQSGPVKSDYRRFNIEGVEPGDDYAAMAQALTRRYSRLQKEGKALPTLVIVDGGKGQLNKAKAVKAALAIPDMTLLGVAKGSTRKAGFETLLGEQGEQWVLAGDDPALHLLQQIRDEAHRFAITGHKAARDKQRRRSRLEDIPGIGAKRRKQLLQHFGGLQGVMAASEEDLARVSGLSVKLAREVYSVLHTE